MMAPKNKITEGVAMRHRGVTNTLLLGVHTFITKWYRFIRVVGGAKTENRICGRPNILSVGRSWDAPLVEIATALSYA